MIDLIRNRFSDKSVVLFGFGREGQSSYALLRRVFPEKRLTIADASHDVSENPLIREDKQVSFITGPDYLDKLNDFDVIFRSPGIPVWNLVSACPPVRPSACPPVHSSALRPPVRSSSALRPLFVHPSSARDRKSTRLNSSH